MALELKPGQAQKAVSIQPQKLTEVVRNKYLVWGDWKHGKTTFAISVAAWWKEMGFPPETCKMAILDLDDGLIPTIEKGLEKGTIDLAYMDCFQYYQPQNFAEVEEATKKAIIEVRANAAKHGVDRSWIVVDNMEAAWEWARNHYAIMTYGMMETEVAAEKRKEFLENPGEKKKQAATFSPQNDYGIINPIHNDWVDSLKFSGVSLMLLAPQKSVKKNFYDNDEVPELKASGQKGNPGRVDHTIRLWRKEAPSLPAKFEYYADIQESRTASVLVNRIPNPTFSLIRQLIKAKPKPAAPKPPVAPATPPGAGASVPAAPAPAPAQPAVPSTPPSPFSIPNIAKVSS